MSTRRTSPSRDSDPERSVLFPALSFVAHFVLGSWGPLLLSVVLLLLSDSILAGHPAGRELSLWCLTGLAGISLGRLVRTIFPRSAATGQTAAILPIGIWLVTILLGIALDPAGKGGLFDYSDGPVSIDGGWPVDLITLPTWSCCWYSLGMRTRRPQS